MVRVVRIESITPTSVPGARPVYTGVTSKTVVQTPHYPQVPVSQTYPFSLPPYLSTSGATQPVQQGYKLTVNKILVNVDEPIQFSVTFYVWANTENGTTLVGQLGPFTNFGSIEIDFANNFTLSGGGFLTYQIQSYSGIGVQGFIQIVGLLEQE